MREDYIAALERVVRDASWLLILLDDPMLAMPEYLGSMSDLRKSLTALAVAKSLKVST